MLEVGKTFKKGDKIFCLVELLNYNNEKYAVFSVEDKELSFIIYKVIENENDYQLIMVNDEQLKFTLFELIEKEDE